MHITLPIPVPDRKIYELLLQSLPGHHKVIFDFLTVFIIRKVRLKVLPVLLSELLDHMSDGNEFLGFLDKRTAIIEDFLLNRPFSFREYLFPWDYIYFKKNRSGEKRAMKHLEAVKKIIRKM